MNGVSASSIGNDIGTALANAASSIAGMQNLIGTVCFISACVFIAHAIVTLGQMQNKHGGGRNGYHLVIAEAVTAFFLLSVSPLLGVIEQTMFNQGIDNNVMSYVTVPVQSTSAIMKAYLEWIQFIGLIGYIRGIYLIRAAAKGDGNSTYKGAVIFMVAGAAAANVGVTISVLDQTFRGTGTS